MPNRFCAICGKDITENAPHYGMCLECYLKENPLFKLVEKLSFKVCIDCGGYTKKEDWINPKENDIFYIIEEAIFNFLLKPYLRKENIDFKISIDEDSLIFSSNDLIKSLDLTVYGILKNNINIKNEQKIKVNINYDLCQNCLNLRGGTYFLSIIQLRVKDKNYFSLIKEVLDNMQKYVEKLFEKDQKQYITKIVDQKNGVDLYLSTNELMNHIISLLRGNYHFILTRSKKLVGRDTQRGKNLYRLKTLIKFLPIYKNDLILIGNKKYFVESITKNKTILRDENGAKLIKDYSYFFNKKILIKSGKDED